MSEANPTLAAATVDIVTRLMIDDLMIDCAHAIDDDDLERWPDFFTEYATYKIISRENQEAGRPLGLLSCDSQGMMRDRILALRTANVYEAHTYCHLLGRSQVTRAGEGYRARTNFSVIRTMQDGTSTRFAAGKYLDELIISDGTMKLVSRLVVLESRRIDILLVIPL